LCKKILNAQHRGAAAVIVANNLGHDQLVIMGGDSRQIKIPSVFVSHDSGMIMRHRVHSTVTDSEEHTSGLELQLSPCGLDSNYYSKDGNMFLPDYLLLFLVFSTMLCSMCTVGFIRWRIQLLYPESAPPIEEHVVINLPQRTCTEEEDQECCICLGSFEVEDVVRILPCRHEYHAQCIDKWLTTHHRTCPICKGDITQTDNETSNTTDSSPSVLSRLLPCMRTDLHSEEEVATLTNTQSTEMQMNTIIAEDSDDQIDQQRRPERIAVQ